ncbi:hypothetical protein JTB14_033503 [Gonioctena quinquepunctata]|nr:hypothetical protein JTB14_033503 [Gonioctena quinquepunctata]
MMFEKLARIIEMQTTVLKELPTRVDKDKIRDYTQLDERFEFAELTHSISVFSQGMRMMKSTLVGVVRLDPKQLLEDGIRKELVQHISKALHSELLFSQKPKQDELEQRLKLLVQIMDGYKRSFEYIQDYININGLRIWQEEVTRIINYNVEQECNGFLRNKIHPWQSNYQSRYVPIPLYPSTDQSVNFVGRLAREVIRLTDPRNSVFLDQTLTWYDIKTRRAILSKETVASIASAIEIAGLVGLDRLFSFMIITALQKLTGYLENKSVKISSWTNIISAIQIEMNQSAEPQNPLKLYQTYINRCTKIWPDFLENVLLVGQLQLLRNLIAFYLNTSCKFNAKNLESSLRSLNKSLLMDIKNEKYHPSENLLLSLSSYFDYAGLNQPLNKIYVTSRNNLDYATTLFVFVIAHLQKLFLPQNNGNIKKTQEQIDGTALSVSVHTILKQFHPEVNRRFVKYMSNYSLQLTKHNTSLKSTELLPEVVLAMKFMDNYTNHSEESRSFYRDCLPEEILHIQQSLCMSST